MLASRRTGQWLSIAALLFAVAIPEPGSAKRATPARALVCRRPDLPVGPQPVGAAMLQRIVDAADGCWKVVNFWAGWCAPCRAEVPRLVALQGDPRLRRLRVITVNMDQREFWSVAHLFLRRARATRSTNFELVPADFDDVREITGGPWNMALPLTVIIGPDGKQRVRHDGELSISRLVEYLIRHDVRDASDEDHSAAHE